jgi:hypothetical protein
MIQRARVARQSGDGLFINLRPGPLFVRGFRRWYYAPLSLQEWFDAYAQKIRTIRLVGIWKPEALKGLTE